MSSTIQSVFWTSVRIFPFTDLGQLPAAGIHSGKRGVLYTLPWTSVLQTRFPMPIGGNPRKERKVKGLWNSNIDAINYSGHRGDLLLLLTGTSVVKGGHGKLVYDHLKQRPSHQGLLISYHLSWSRVQIISNFPSCRRVSYYRKACSRSVN